MIEVIVAVFGMLISGYICSVFGPYLQQYTDHAPERKGSSLVFWTFGTVGLYCMVRVVHWAWFTPMPLVGNR